ncbi:MAG: metallophosphoesterase [Actinobacteria bacterium]|nr:metallophosphoesterase [Actinomycetota bacterium]
MRTRFIVSDLHLGAGDYLDDFDQDEAFVAFLTTAAKRRGAELILNGDWIDFVAVNLEKPSHRPFSRMGCTEGESLSKLERVLEAHAHCFEALRRFMEKGHRVVVVPGNHDVDLFWPRVRDRLLEVLGGPDSDHFHFEASGVYRFGSVHVEHGNQYYADSVFEHFTHPFLRDPKTGELRLERSWGNCFLEYFSNGMMSERNPFINNVRPIPNMVFMGIQDESWWFKLAYGYKLMRFMSRVGFPPFRESRELLRRKREGRLDSWGYTRKRFLDLLSGRGKVELMGIDDAEGLSAEFPPEEEHEEPAREQEGLLLDSLATREDALSVAARDLLLSDQGIDVVVFGHDHRYYSNELQPVLGGKKGKYYVNTGTWIPMLFLTRTRRQLRWRDLRDESLYQQLLTYAVVRRGLGGYHASLRRIDRVRRDGDAAGGDAPETG